MHLEPRCVLNRHKCKQLCVSPKCTIDNVFICDTCENHHSKECELANYQDVVRRLEKNQGLRTKQAAQFEEEVERVFSTLIKNLQAEFVRFRDWFEVVNAVPEIEYPP